MCVVKSDQKSIFHPCETNILTRLDIVVQHINF
jgi:hypothetical protein